MTPPRGRAPHTATIARVGRHRTTWRVTRFTPRQRPRCYCQHLGRFGCVAVPADVRRSRLRATFVVVGWLLYAKPRVTCWDDMVGRCPLPRVSEPRLPLPLRYRFARIAPLFLPWILRPRCTHGWTVARMLSRAATMLADWLGIVYRGW